MYGGFLEFGKVVHICTCMLSVVAMQHSTRTKWAEIVPATLLPKQQSYYFLYFFASSLQLASNLPSMAYYTA